ncbi:phage tail protein [Natrarchaeobaculum aegyptiacum]|nr:phage tail protein [Natrarchaeobaculum aegyptiacum]
MIGDDIVDVSVDPTGTLYLLTMDGGLYEYDVTTETRELVIDRTSRHGWAPQSIATAGSRVFVTHELGETTAVIPETRRETKAIEVPVDTPSASTYGCGALHVVDDAGTLVSIRGDKQETNQPPGTIVDATTVTDGLVVLTATGDGYGLWRSESNRSDTDGDEPRLSETLIAADHRFTPTAITGTEESLVLAGVVENRNEYALFEYKPGTKKLTRLETVESDGPIETLISTESEDGMRSFYAIDTHNRCLALTERTEYLGRTDRNKHTGIAMTRYDSETEQLEWHRLTVDLARFPANTRLKIRYYATDEPLLPLETPTSGGETETTPDSSGVGAGETVPSNEPSDQWAPLRSADVCRSLQAAGVSSGMELARSNPKTIATHEESLSSKTVRKWQRTAFNALEKHAESEWTVAEGDESPDILLHDAVGRYLYVALELIGTPTASPLVDTVTAYCPRQSYLRYMPELYQEDKRSAAFLERFLSVFETSFVDIQSEIDGITKYFDPHGAPSNSLEWLEDWLAADEYREWPESARREYLARAPELYKKRGTRAGLRDVIELYLRHATDKKARDSSGAEGETMTGHRLFFLEPADVELGTDGVSDSSYDSLVPTDRSVAVFCGPFESAVHEEAIETITETETPAHVDATVYVVDDEFELGRATFLGVNTHLGTESFSLGDATLGQDTYLSGTNEG